MWSGNVGGLPAVAVADCRLLKWLSFGRHLRRMMTDGESLIACFCLSSAGKACWFIGCNVHVSKCEQQWLLAAPQLCAAGSTDSSCLNRCYCRFVTYALSVCEVCSEGQCLVAGLMMLPLQSAVKC